MATTIQALARRLGKNLGGYFGDGIDIAAVLSEIRNLARSHAWSIENFAGPGYGNGSMELIALHRTVPNPLFRIYISAGIHGDEPAGPLATLELLKNNAWPSCAEIWLCPCLNPPGFFNNKRESASGADLNRDYRDARTPEVQAHTAWLQRQPSFDCCFCLHEDWEAQGFYVYELNPENRPSLARDMVAAAARVCPIDQSPQIDGRDAREGIIRPVINIMERPDWPEAFYLITHRTRVSYTLEAPSDFPLAVRVAALASACTAALQKACMIAPPKTTSHTCESD